MSHLTDTQLVILSNAAQAEDGSILPLPDCLTINGGAISSVLSSLLRKGLVEERLLHGAGTSGIGSHATGSAPFGACHGQERVWHTGDNFQRLALTITRAGLDAIGIKDEEDAAEDMAAHEATPSIGQEDTYGPTAADSREPASPGSADTAPHIRPGTRQALLVDLLRRDGGASLEELVQATGWQQHSVRGAISSTVRKKLGLTVMSEKVEGRGRVYRIVP